MSEQSAAWEYKEESPLREAWKMYLQNRAAVLGLILLGAVLLLTCVGPLAYPVGSLRDGRSAHERAR